MTKVAADLLTPDEITAMMKVCTSPVERAFIMTLYTFPEVLNGSCGYKSKMF